MGDEVRAPKKSNIKVASACQRCKRQKLKCDVERPCTLCTRAGVRCIAGLKTRWKPYQPLESHPHPAQALSTSHTASDAAQSDQLRTSTTSGASPDFLVNTGLPTHGNGGSWNSSSTMSLVDGAFQMHNASTPGNPATNALPGGQTQEGGLEASSDEEGMRTVSPSTNTGGKVDNTLVVQPVSLFSNSALIDMMRLLPKVEVASLLVDTYFDRVHWFMLIFHQDEFRQRWPKLYQLSRRQSRQISNWTGLVSTFLMVVAIGLQYAGPHRQQLLARHGVGHDLKERILSTIRARLLDIVSLGSLEAVQTCVLLGTFYLYHGSPRLAWPVCGCGLRIAQALQLHRKMQSSGTPNFHMKNETRKRCWWAIYEIETFCAVSYGYPHSIRDADCDVEPLDPSAKLPVSQSPNSFDEPLTGEATLLSYKYFMSKLSLITKKVLTELYRIGTYSIDDAALVPPSSSLRVMIQKVADFDTHLRRWDEEIPAKLRWRNVAHNTNYKSLQEVDEDIGASGSRFENHIYQLQALALTLAYESARILVYRPLLSYKIVNRPESRDVSEVLASNSANVLNESLKKCRDAAINMSDISSSTIVDLVSETYAAGFVSIHTFTAGVTLGIITSMDPLNAHSGDSKRGLRQLMGIQEKLKWRSIMAEQGLEILQRLTKLVMEKELSLMLDFSNTGLTDSNTTRIEPPGHNVNNGSTVPTPSITSHHRRAVPSSGDDPTTPLAEIGQVDTSNVLNDVSFQYIENPALSGALDDFDQALSTYMPRPQHVDGDTLLDSSFLPQAQDFPMLEQTWFWGLDNIASYIGNEDQQW